MAKGLGPARMSPALLDFHQSESTHREAQADYVSLTFERKNLRSKRVAEQCSNGRVVGFELNSVYQNDRGGI